MSSKDPNDYSGAEWLESAIKKPLSPLGTQVADFLGYLFHGIYHLPHSIKLADWQNDQWIELSIPTNSLATTDYDGLTRLVFLAHFMALRVQIQSSSPSRVKLIFHQRKRGGRYFEHHPSLQEAVDAFTKTWGYIEVKALEEAAK